MTKTGAERQADFRRRLNYRLTTAVERVGILEQALRDVIELTGDKTGETAVAIRARCVEALGE